MTSVPAPESKLMEITRLTQRELHLLFIVLNGQAPRRLDFIFDFRRHLVDILYFETESAFEDVKEFGGHLGLPENNGSEVPHELAALMEKVKEMRQEEAAFLLGLAIGFWESRASMYREPSTGPA
ncbi:hypothetical protein [Nevskia ramosa]|uniref:hypothetical protein n=1 Tax=Nevskia ramosa TaxID=64002 RepID=UPI003D12DC0B